MDRGVVRFPLISVVGGGMATVAIVARIRASNREPCAGGPNELVTEPRL